MKSPRLQAALSVIVPSFKAFCNTSSLYSSVHWSSAAEEEDFCADEEDIPEAENDEPPEEEDDAGATEDELPAVDEEIPLLLLELREAEVASAELSHPAQKKAQRASSSFSHRDLDFLKNGFMDVNINSSANLSRNF